jgi:hypothetical protein
LQRVTAGAIRYDIDRARGENDVLQLLKRNFAATFELHDFKHEIDFDHAVAVAAEGVPGRANDERNRTVCI